MKANKQLKEEYQHKKFKMGVFQIRNTVNGKMLIGSSVNLDAIWNRHKVELKFNGHRNKMLQDEWNQFGEDNFKFEILSEIAEKEGDKIDYAREVKELETMFMEELQPYGERGYHPAKV
jgi:group I intron endonuclease